jgi:hypothetical protein
MNRTITVAAVRRSPMESPMPKMIFVKLPVADVAMAAMGRQQTETV